MLANLFDVGSGYIRKAIISLWLIYVMVACAEANTGSSYETSVAETIYAGQTKEAALPTAKPTRTPTLIPTIATTPTPVLDGLPTSPKIPISSANVNGLALLGILEPKWPDVFMGPTAVKYSPETGVFAIGTLHGVYLLDGENFQPLLHHEIGGEVTSLAFSPDGQVLAIGSFGKIVLFDILTEGSFATLQLTELWWAPVTDIIFSRDGKTLLIGAEDQVQYWDMESRMAINKFKFPSQQNDVIVQQVFYSPHDELEFVRLCEGYQYHGNYQNCSLWIRKSDPASTYQKISPRRIAFSLDDSLMLLTGIFGTMVLDISELTDEEIYGKLTNSLSPSDGFVLSNSRNSSNNAVSSDGKMAALAVDDLITVYKSSDWKQEIEFNLDAEPYELVFTPDGKKLIAWRSCLGYTCKEYYRNVKNYIKILDIETGISKDLIEITGPYTEVVFSPDGKYLVARDGFNRIQVINTETGKTLYVIHDKCEECQTSFDLEIPLNLSIENYQSQSIGFSPDSRILAISFAESQDRKGYVQLYSVENGEPFLELQDNDCRPAGRLQFSPDGTILATAYRNKVCLWLIPEGSLFYTLTTREEMVFYISALAFSSDGTKLAAGNSSGEEWLWQTDTWDLSWSFPVHEGYDSLISDLVFISGDQILVSAGLDETVRIRKTSDGSAIRLFTTDNIPLNLRFSPDETIYIYGGSIPSTSSVILDFNTMGCLRVIGNSNVISADFSSDGSWLVTTHNDGNLYFWGIP